jgi:uncharacterized protein (DUF736 family)
MATIGTFTQDDAGAFNGSIKTLTLNVKQATFRKVDKDNDKAPRLPHLLRLNRVRRRLEEDLPRGAVLPLGQAG